MAGAGFEPAKAEPSRLQRDPFDRSGTPPGPSSIAIKRGWSTAAAAPARPQTRRSWAAEEERCSAANHSGWDEPSPAIGHKDKEAVAAARAEPLDEATPAAVPATRAHHDPPASVLALGTRLDLHAQQRVAIFGDQVAVRAVPDWEPNAIALRAEPLHRGELAEIALPTRRYAVHRSNVRAAWDRTLRPACERQLETAGRQRPPETWPTRPRAAAVRRAAPGASSASGSRSGAPARA
jgi:hypothetical protein